MARKNDKPKNKSLTQPTRSERRIKVSSILSERKKHTATNHYDKIETLVPWIRMQGKWLQEAGFEIDQPVRIRVMRGCLVLTID